MTKHEKIILFLLATLNFTHILDFIIMVPMSIYLIPSFGISAFQFSLLVASYSVSAFFSGLVVAMIVDQQDRKKSLITAYVGFLIGTFACGISNSFILLLGARIITGIFGGILGAQVLSIVSDLFQYERRGRAMGAVMSAFAVASVIGIPLSLYLTNTFHSNWHIPFLSIAGLGLLLVPFLIKYIPNMRGHINMIERRSVFSPLVKILKMPFQRSAILFSALFMFGHFLVIPFIPSYLEFNKAYTKEQIPLILLAGGVASFAAAIYLGRFSDTRGKLPVFIWCVLSSLVFVLILTNMPNMHLGLALGFFAILFMAVTGRIVMAQAMISGVVTTDQRGSFMSVNGSVQHLGQGLASLAAGAIIHTEKVSHRMQHYDWVGYLSVIVLVVSLSIGLNVFRKVDRAVANLKSAQIFREATGFINSPGKRDT